WDSLVAVNLSTGAAATTYTSANTNNLLRVSCGGVAKVRVISNPYVAGTATVTAEGGLGSLNFGLPIQGMNGNGTALNSFPVAVGQNDGGGNVRYITGVNQSHGSTTGNGLTAVSPLFFDGSTTYHRALSANGAAATAGTGLPGAGCL